MLESLGRKLDLVVLFEAPDETLVKRLSGRRSCPSCGAVYNTFFNPPSVDDVCDRCGGTPLAHRADDEPETVRRRLVVYQEQTAPLVSHYEAHSARVERIDADRPVDRIYADFGAAVRAES